MPPKTWEVLSSRKECRYKFFSLRTDHARSPRTGESYDFVVLETGTWVNIIPVTAEGKVVFVRQYRHGIRDITLEFPGGVVEEHDSPEEAARRELREETGFTSDEIISLGWVHPNPAIQNNRCYTYLAANAVREGTQHQDDREDIEIVLIPISDIPGLIRDGSITHGLIIAAFQLCFLNYPAVFQR